MAMVVRFSVWGVNLSPTQGSEQAGYRPVLMISPQVMNDNLNTVIVAPMTTRIRRWPTRVSIVHDGKHGEIALDQIRAIDKARLGSCMGHLGKEYHKKVIAVLTEMFADEG
jgi:mRNA interferase MazF